MGRWRSPTVATVGPLWLPVTRRTAKGPAVAGVGVVVVRRLAWCRQGGWRGVGKAVGVGRDEQSFPRPPPLPQMQTSHSAVAILCVGVNVAAVATGHGGAAVMVGGASTVANVSAVPACAAGGVGLWCRCPVWEAKTPPLDPITAASTVANAPVHGGAAALVP